MSKTGPLHVGFTWFLCARGKRGHFNWLDSARCANGCEKSVGCLRSNFGCFGINFGPNGRPMGSFERWDLKLSVPSVKPAEKHGEDQRIGREKSPLKKEAFRSLFCPVFAHPRSDWSIVKY